MLAGIAGMCFGAPWAPYITHTVIHVLTILTNGFWEPSLRLPIIPWQALLADAMVLHGPHIGPTKLSLVPQA